MAKQIIHLNVRDVEKRRHPSKHYVYVIHVTWSDDSATIVYRRYNRFFELQTTLLEKFPEEAGLKNPADRIIPFLPGKIFFGRSSILNVALKRLTLLDCYCRDLLKLPIHIPQCDDVLRFFESTPEDLLPESKSSDVQTERYARDISHPTVTERYRVATSYQTGKMNLRAGSMVEVLEKTETGWWSVRTDVSEGWVPAAYLESTDRRPDTRHVSINQQEGWKYVCTRSYKPQKGDEVGVDKGGLVQVLEQSLDGWWLVRYKGQTGRTPGTNLVRTDTLKAHRLKDLLGGISALLPRPGSIGAPSADKTKNKSGQAVGDEYRAIADFPSQMTGGINLKEDDRVIVSSKSKSGWWMVTCGSRHGLAPSTYLERVDKTAVEHKSEGSVDDDADVSDNFDDDFDDDDDEFDDDDDLLDYATIDECNALAFNDSPTAFDDATRGADNAPATAFDQAVRKFDGDFTAEIEEDDKEDYEVSWRVPPTNAASQTAVGGGGEGKPSVPPKPAARPSLARTPAAKPVVPFKPVVALKPAARRVDEPRRNSVTESPRDATAASLFQELQRKFEK